MAEKRRIINKREGRREMEQTENMKLALAQYKKTRSQGYKPDFQRIANDCGVDFYEFADALFDGRVRWDCNNSCETQSSRVDAFLEDIARVCKDWDFSISHEDKNGDFIVTDFNGHDIEWLMGAAVQLHE